MHKVQDYKLGLMVDGIPAMVRGGGRGGAALLTEMVAFLFYNTNGAVYLLHFA